MKISFVKRFVIILFFLSPVLLNAQSIPVWYKGHGIDLRKMNFVKYIKNNSIFSIVKAVDTIRVPETMSFLLIDREGKFFQELSLDTAAYCNSREYIIAGKKRTGRNLIGIANLKGEAIIPMEYLEIRSNRNLFALKNQEFLWALFDTKGTALSAFVYTDMNFTSFGKVLIKDQKGAGVLNEDGSLLIESIYGEVSQVSEDSILLKEQDRWQYLDRDKKVGFEWRADSIKALNDSLFLVYSEGRVFVKDSSGRITGSDKGYHKIEKLNDRTLKISLGEYSGLMDLYGKELLPIRYYDFLVEKTGYIKVLGDEIKVLRYGDVVNKGKRRWSLHDSLGRKILTKQYKTIRSYQQGWVAVQNDEGLWGFADEKGRVVMEPKFTYASDFKNGYSLVKYPGAKENDYRLIDKKEQVFFKGKEAQLFFLEVIRYRLCEDSSRKEGEPESELYYGVPPDRYDRYILAECGYIRTKNGSYSGVLDPQGKEVVQAYQDTVYLASSDTFFLYKRKDGRIGFSDRYGNTALYMTDRFEEVEPLQEGYSKFKKEGLYGFMDPYGNIHIAPKYTACGEFHNGMAAIFLKGKWGFIDKNENLKVQPYYKEVKPFRNGFAPVKTIKNKWIFIDKEGKQVNSSLYDDFWKLKNEKYIVVKNKKWGIADPSGREILSPKYDYIESIGENRLKVKKDGKYGVMDFQENIVLYYQYDDVLYNAYSDSFFVKTKGASRKVAIAPTKK